MVSSRNPGPNLACPTMVCLNNVRLLFSYSSPSTTHPQASDNPGPSQPPYHGLVQFSGARVQCRAPTQLTHMPMIPTRFSSPQADGARTFLPWPNPTTLPWTSCCYASAVNAHCSYPTPQPEQRATPGPPLPPFQRRPGQLYKYQRNHHKPYLTTIH